MEGSPLTPTQRRALIDLMGSKRDRPTFPEDLGATLRSTLETGLAPVAATLETPLLVRKRDLAQVHACEAHYLAQLDVEFTWTPRSAQGTVAHKAIELSVQLPLYGATELVDLAIDRIVDDGSDWGPAAYLSEAPAGEVAELRTFAIDTVHKFQEEFPPLKREWRPRVESSMSAAFAGERIVLRGKVDLALGRAEGTTARVMILDFKTGQRAPVHIDDLRFYALLETLRVGVPPFRVVSWYLDSGTWHAEDVDEGVLEAAARRVIGAAEKMAELHRRERAPKVVPGPSCGFCPINDECPGASAWADQRAELGYV